MSASRSVTSEPAPADVDIDMSCFVKLDDADTSPLFSRSNV